MKKLAFNLIILIFLFTLYGCGTENFKNESSSFQEPSAPAVDSMPQYKNSDSNDAYIAENFPLKRKIIQNISVNLIAKSEEEVFDLIQDEVSKINGYVANSSKIDNGKKARIYLEVRIPSEKLTDFIKFIEGLGEVKNMTTSTEEITSDYYDVKARLQNAINQKDKLLEIMSRANTIDEILKVQKEIDLVQERIEQFQGQLKLWDSLVDFSTVRIEISQDPKSSIASEGVKLNPFSFKEWLNYAKNGFIHVLNFIIIFFQWIFLIIVSAAIPIIIIIIIFLIIRKIKKQKKIKQEKTEK